MPWRSKRLLGLCRLKPTEQIKLINTMQPGTRGALLLAV
jgi:hypothetical protein